MKCDQNLTLFDPFPARALKSKALDPENLNPRPQTLKP